MRQSIAMVLGILLMAVLACSGEGERKRGPIENEASEEGSTKKTTTTTSSTAGFDADYGNTNRVIWQKPEMVIQLLGNLEEKVVADIGAGTGFFSLRLTPKSKKVIAIDIDQRFINYLDSIKILELPDPLQSRLETRLATKDDPNLASNEADVAVIVNTYMYIDKRVEYLKTLKKGLTPGCKLLIIDLKKKRIPFSFAPPPELRIPLYLVEEELYKAGFVNIQTYDTTLDYQYIVIAECSSI